MPAAVAGFVLVNWLAMPRAAQQKAEQIVASAHRAVLLREPDPASRVYVDKVLRENWTEADVSRELRNSPEYRSKHQ